MEENGILMRQTMDVIRYLEEDGYITTINVK